MSVLLERVQNIDGIKDIDIVQNYIVQSKNMVGKGLIIEYWLTT